MRMRHLPRYHVFLANDLVYLKLVDVNAAGDAIGVYWDGDTLQQKSFHPGTIITDCGHAKSPKIPIDYGNMRYVDWKDSEPRAVKFEFADGSFVGELCDNSASMVRRGQELGAINWEFAITTEYEIDGPARKAAETRRQNRDESMRLLCEAYQSVAAADGPERYHRWLNSVGR